MKRILLVLLCFGLIGCASLGSVKNTNELMPGMTIAEVKKIFGEPSGTQFVGNKLVLKYNLHQYWKGWTPYYLAFDKDSNKLDSWYADEAEYYRSQRLWLDAMPKQVNVNANIQEEIHGNIQHDVNVR